MVSLDGKKLLILADVDVVVLAPALVSSFDDDDDSGVAPVALLLSLETR